MSDITQLEQVITDNDQEFCRQPVMCALLVAIFLLLTMPGWALVYAGLKAFGF